MPISMECPSCMTTFVLPDETAGRKSKCPECQFTVFVPRAATTIDPPTAVPPPQAASENQPPKLAAVTPVPAKKPRAAKRSTAATSTAPAGGKPFHFDKEEPRAARGRQGGGMGGTILLVVVVFLVLGSFVLLSGGVAAWFLYNRAAQEAEITNVNSLKAEIPNPQVESPPRSPRESDVKETPPKNEPPPKTEIPSPITEPPKPKPMPVKQARLTLAPLASQTAKAGERVTMSVRVVREECQGEVRLSVASPHPTIQVMPDAMIPADMDRAALLVTVDRTAPPGTYEIRVTAALGALSDSKTFELKIEQPAAPVVVNPPPADQGNKPLQILNTRIHVTGSIYSADAGAVESVALSGNAKWAVSGSADGAVRLWELDKGQVAVIHEGQKGTGVSAVALSRDGKWAAFGDVKGGVYLHDLEKKGTQILQPPAKGAAAKDNRINALEFSPKNDVLVVASQLSVTSWNVATAKQIMTTAVLADSPSVHFAADGANVYAIAGKGMAIFDPRRVAPPSFLGGMGKLAELSATCFDVYAAKQEIIAVVRKDKSAELQRINANTAQPQQLAVFAELAESPRHVVVADKAGYAVTTDATGLIRGLDLDTGKEIFKLGERKSEVLGLAVSADGHRCITGCADGSFRIINLSNEKPAP